MDEHTLHTQGTYIEILRSSQECVPNEQRFVKDVDETTNLL